MADIHKLIAAISPDVYCDSSVRSKVKKILAEKPDNYLAASKEAKPMPSVEIDIDGARGSPLKLKGIKNPIEKHNLMYDSASESLEPIYFWILDFTNKMFGGKVEKITDNFVSSPGSAYFSELGAKATKMQEEAMKTLGTVNTLIRSILNLIYDLKEFRLRLGVYDNIKSEKSEERRSALLSLKQIWLDNVDIKRGNSSVKAMAQQFDFVTLIDAFMSADTIKDVEKIDLNERVKRIIIQRIGEFLRWKDESERELRKRFEIEKRYLKSQSNMVKLYSRWVKPYLKTARQLEQSASPGAALVTAFNSIIMELTLLAKSPYDPEEDVKQGNLPSAFKNVKARKYNSILLIDFKFRGIPQRVGQGYSFGGRTEINFTSYGLNDEELDILKKEMEKDDMGEVMRLIDGATEESIEKLQEDINSFLEEDENPQSVKKSGKKEEDANPFSALFSFFKMPKDETKSSLIKKDNEFEEVLRSIAILEARKKCYDIFDIYKRAHQMPAFS